MPPSSLPASGLTWAEYRREIGQNGEIFDEVYANPAYTEQDLARLRRLPPLTVAVIAEDWCPDVYHTLGTWARLADELPGWRLFVFPKAKHPGLMQRFLWRGKAERIPVYAFYDDSDQLQGWWSGRSGEAQRTLDGWLAGRAYGDLPAAEKEDLGRRLATAYRERFQRANFEEILRLLMAFFHLDD